MSPGSLEQGSSKLYKGIYFPIEELKAEYDAVYNPGSDKQYRWEYISHFVPEFILIPTLVEEFWTHNVTTNSLLHALSQGFIGEGTVYDYIMMLPDRYQVFDTMYTNAIELYFKVYRTLELNIDNISNYNNNIRINLAIFAVINEDKDFFFELYRRDRNIMLDIYLYAATFNPRVLNWINDFRNHSSAKIVADAVLLSRVHPKVLELDLLNKAMGNENPYEFVNDVIDELDSQTGSDTTQYENLYEMMFKSGHFPYRQFVNHANVETANIGLRNWLNRVDI